MPIKNYIVTNMKTRYSWLNKSVVIVGDLNEEPPRRFVVILFTI